MMSTTSRKLGPTVVVFMGVFLRFSAHLYLKTFQNINFSKLLPSNLVWLQSKFDSNKIQIKHFLPALD